MPSRFGHTVTRHPHCPGCDYDLIATVEANGRVCPECGYEFELGELRHEPRPGDWTVGRGIRRAAVSLVLRGLAAAPVWALAVWGTTKLAAGAGMRALPVLTLAVLLGISGIFVGAIMARRLIDRAGFVSFLLPILASGFAFGAVAAGTWLAHLAQPMTPAHRSMAVVFGWIAASIWITRATLFDDG